MQSAPLLGDEVGYRFERAKLPVLCAALLALGRLSHESPRAQIGERVRRVHWRKAGHSSAAHRHHHLAALGGMAHIPAQLIVKLTNADFGLWLM